MTNDEIEAKIDAIASDLAGRLTRLLLEADEFGAGGRLHPHHSGFSQYGDWKYGTDQAVPDEGVPKRRPPRGWY